MRKIFGVVAAFVLLLGVAGCAAEPNGPNPTDSASFSTPDPNLIPPVAGEEVKAVDPAIFDVGFSEYLFRAGQGSVWCTINTDEQWVLCEQNEADAEYDPVAAPAECEYSYGYQIKLWQTTPVSGSTAGFVCASGYYSDPSVAQVLNNDEKVTVGGITCYVNDVTARCDNESGQYIALGAKVWAAKN